MEQPVSPTAMAREFRAKAETLTGADRDYCLWLAGEWDKSATCAAPPAGPNGRQSVRLTRQLQT